jgi:hypothetical protein
MNFMKLIACASCRQSGSARSIKKMIAVYSAAGALDVKT